MSEKKFIPPESLGGVVLEKKIGEGGFGDVYISRDHKICVKIITPEKCKNPENYERELNAVKCISSCIREHCGIAKFLGSCRTDKNFNYEEPFHPCGGIRTADPERYRQYPVIPDSMQRDCQKWEGQSSQKFFYYFMLAADNLAKEPDYCPDTLENRCERGILPKMSDQEKIQVIAEIIDSLLFLYNLEVTNQLNRESSCFPKNREKEIFHITHGDIKPANIFFVNGHAQLGDMGATLQVNPENMPSIGTPGFMFQGFPQKILKEKCGENYFAYSVFSDIYALGKTAEYMMSNRAEGGHIFSELSELVDCLKSFHCSKKIQPDNVVEKLKEFRTRRIGCANHFRKPSYYGTTAPDIELKDLYEFSRMWKITEAETVNRFRVTNETSEWGQYSDILLAERFPANKEAEIRKKEAKLLAGNKTNGCPLLIFQLKQSGEIIVLSHSNTSFTASAKAYILLQNDIRNEHWKEYEDPDFDFPE